MRLFGVVAVACETWIACHACLVSYIMVRKSMHCGTRGVLFWDMSLFTTSSRAAINTNTNTNTSKHCTKKPNRTNPNEIEALGQREKRRSGHNSLLHQFGAHLGISFINNMNKVHHAGEGGAWVGAINSSTSTRMYYK